jgi:ZIP family zinc transporter
MAIYVALFTVLSTALGGALALRSRDSMHLLLGLSAGLLLGLVSFDLLPEVFELNKNTIGNVPAVAVYFVLGFFLLHLVERLSGSHEPFESEYVDDHEHAHHHTAGVIGASAMVIHVFLDGVAIGLSFHISNSLGLAVAIAVIGHAFTDGLNTVALLVNTGNWKKSAIGLLALDGVARVSGAYLGGYALEISDAFLGGYLALFAGMLIYLATSHILPEAHSTHPSRITLLSTLTGLLAMFAIINFA